MPPRFRGWTLRDTCLSLFPSSVQECFFAETYESELSGSSAPSCLRNMFFRFNLRLGVAFVDDTQALQGQQVIHCADVLGAGADQPRHAPTPPDLRPPPPPAPPPP